MILPSTSAPVGYGAETLLEMRDVSYADLQTALETDTIEDTDLRTLVFDKVENKFVFKNLYPLISKNKWEFIETESETSPSQTSAITE